MPTRKMIIAIDPGNEGAVARYRGRRWDVHDCPTVTITTRNARTQSGKSTKEYCDAAGMAYLLKSLVKGAPEVQAFIEKVTAGRGQGATSMFNFGQGFGMWKGILAALEIPYTEVTPQSWKKIMMAGFGADKAASIARAKQLFPYLTPHLTLKKHDGLAEAALIGEYARRHLAHL